MELPEGTETGDRIHGKLQTLAEGEAWAPAWEGSGMHVVTLDLGEKPKVDKGRWRGGKST